MKTAKFTKSLTISLQPEVFKRIKKITDKEQISISEWTRAAVERALDKHQREEGFEDE
jgi:hypothetical protein